MKRVSIVWLWSISICTAALADEEGAFVWPEGKRAALSLTFDDGHENQLDIGIPLLDEFGVKATFYVLLFRVEERLEGWRQVAADGHEIGNHSMGHPCTGNFTWAREDRVELENYDLARMEAELARANRIIEELLGVRPVTFAYPCGQSFVGRGARTQSYVPLVDRAFLAGRSWLDEVANVPEFCDLAQIMARRMDGQGFDDIRPFIDDAMDEGRWLVLAGHRVGHRGPYSTDAEMLRQLLEYTQQHRDELWVAPLGTVAAYVDQQRGLGK